MAKANEPVTGLTGFLSKMLAKASPADLKDMLQDAQLSKAFDVIEAGAESLTSSDFVPDLWASGEGQKVPTAEEVKTGPEQFASGDNAQRQIAQYSGNQVGQRGLTELATRLGGLVSRMGSMEKSLHAVHQHVSLLSTGVQKVLEKSIEADAALAKAVEAQTAAAAVAKAAEPAAEVSKGFPDKDEEDDDEKAKSLMVAGAAKTLAVSKSLIAKAEELEGDGMAGSAKSRRDEARVALVKAKTMLDAAGAMGATGDDVTKLAKSMEVFATAKSMQDVYPDSAKGDAVAKSEDKKEDDEVAKAQAAIVAKSAEIEAALAGLAVMKSDVQNFMATVSGMSRSPGGPPNTTALAKSDPQSYARGKSAEVMRMQDEGVMSNEDVMAAHDILGKMQAASSGFLPPNAVADRIRGASSTVRSFFQDAA